MLAAAAITPVSATATTPVRDDLLRAYVQARAAEAVGDQGRAATLFAGLSRADPTDPTIAQRALHGAIAAGNASLALRIARALPTAQQGIEGRLLLVADDLRSRRVPSALALLETPGQSPDLTFLAPLVRAWDQYARHDPAALTTIGQIPVSGPLGAFVPEQRALILAAFGQTAAAESFARSAIASAGGRETRVRLVTAEAFRSAGDRAQALAMLDGQGRSLAAARARVTANQPIGGRIDTPAAAMAEVLLGLAISLNREDDQDLPIAMAQISRVAAPANSEGAIILGLLLDQDGRSNDALAAFAAVPPSDFLGSQALDARARTLLKLGRDAEALQIARGGVAKRDADAGDFMRFGDTLAALKRPAEAADAYLRGAALTPVTGPGSAEAWSALLLAGSALEDAGRWTEARGAVEKALALAPENPLLLNFLGYAKLTHGEDLDVAEAMIRKASALRPNDASITDSLGWALYKRGKLAEAIATLQKAAAGDPAQSEIGEHLGDALYIVGRRFEARFAWRAALVTADAKPAARIQAKLDRGLAPATAAP